MSIRIDQGVGSSVGWDSKDQLVAVGALLQVEADGSSLEKELKSQIIYRFNYNICNIPLPKKISPKLMHYTYMENCLLEV